MKGIIADINEKSAVLLSEDGEFREIKNKGYSVGQNIAYNIPSYTKIAAIAASIILCISASISGVKTYFTPTGYIDVDINPSMRIGINAFERVIEFTSLNDDAQTLLDAVGKPKGKINQCLEAIVEKSEDLGFINSGNCDVDIEIISDNQDFYDKTEQYCKGIAEHNDRVNINIHKADEENFSRAQELGISVGKLRLIDDYRAVSGEDTDSDDISLPDMSNNEIKQLIESVRNTKHSAAEAEVSGRSYAEDIVETGKKMKKSENNTSVAADSAENIYEKAAHVTENTASGETAQEETTDTDEKKSGQTEKEGKRPEKTNEKGKENVKEAEKKETERVKKAAEKETQREKKPQK